MTVAISNPTNPFRLRSQLYGAGFWSHNGLINFIAANVNNGSVTDQAFHIDTSGIGSWLRFDAGLDQRKAFIGVTVYTQQLASDFQIAYFLCEVHFSDNNIDWTVLAPPIGPRAIVGGRPIYTGGAVSLWGRIGSHRYWRLYKVNAAAVGGYISEVQFFVP